MGQRCNQNQCHLRLVIRTAGPGYITFSTAVLGFIINDRPYESLIGLGIVLVGGATYWLGPRPVV